MSEEQEKMFTRADYLNGVCTHRQYYAQFVTDKIKAHVLRRFTIRELCVEHEKDASFNGTSLQAWDMLAYGLQVDKELRKHGDTPALCGKVCILKEAAEQIVEHERKTS